jgi:hypothetical protein
VIDGYGLVRHIPAWFPGAAWKRWAAHARRLSDEFTNVPYMMVKQQIVRSACLAYAMVILSVE